MRYVNLAKLAVSFITLFPWLLVQAFQSSPNVQTETGSLYGELIQLPTGEECYQFLGIPYAEAPEGIQRFKDKPRPKQRWNSTLTATSFKSQCFLADNMGGGGYGGGSDQCLNLNIWVPRRIFDRLGGNKSPSTAVFVLLQNKMPMLNGAIMATYNDIIVVTPQFRIGPVGFSFLGVGNSIATPNLGLWDQVEALKWINNNIDKFGGNKSAIALGGLDVGAIHASFHMVSKHSQGLFQRLILQSGIFTMPLPSMISKFAKENSQKFFSQICREQCSTACNNVDTPNFYNCFKMSTSTNYNSILNDIELLTSDFLPIVDGDFITDDPIKLIERGEFNNVPILFGLNRDDAALKVLSNFYTVTEQGQRAIVVGSFTLANFDGLVENQFEARFPNSSLVHSAIEATYWPSKDVHDVVAQSLIMAETDYRLACPLVKWAKRTVEKSVAMFGYHFTEENTTLNVFSNLVTNSDEFFYVYGMPFADGDSADDSSDSRKQLSKVMMAYWANFIKTGDPNNGPAVGENWLNWPDMTKQRSSCFLEINSNSIQNRDAQQEVIVCDFKKPQCRVSLLFFKQIPCLCL